MNKQLHMYFLEVNATLIMYVYKKWQSDFPVANESINA